MPSVEMPTLGSATGVRGQCVWGRWRPIADEPGTEIDVALIQGNEPGPTLWLQGAIHGNETDGALLVNHVVQAIDATQLRGAVVAIPVVNRAAFELGRRDGPSDRKDANRQFPGDPDGTFSDQLAYGISTAIKETADAVIDVHSSTETFIAVSHSLYFASESEASKEAQAIARRARVEVIWESSGDYMLQALYCWATQSGIPCVLLDVGDLDVSPGLPAAVDGALEMCRRVGLLPEAKADKPETIDVRDPRWVAAGSDGIVLQAVHPGARLGAGDKLFDVFNARGDVVDTKYNTINDALVLTTRRLHKVAEGDWVISIGEVIEQPGQSRSMR